MMQTQRRKRKRKPTSEGRFVKSSVAYEIGLIRLALEAQKEFLRGEKANEPKLNSLSS